MSNQGRHVGSRRLPPLHGLGGKQTSVHSSQLKTGTTVTSPFGKSPGPTLPKNADIKQGHFGDMVITGECLVILSPKMKGTYLLEKLYDSFIPIRTFLVLKSI